MVELADNKPVEEMTFIKKFTYSLLSPETRHVVKESFSPVKRTIHLSFNSVIKISSNDKELPTICLQPYRNTLDNPVELKTPELVGLQIIGENRRLEKWENPPELSFRSWILQMIDILSCSRITLGFYSGQRKIIFDSILETLQGIPIQELSLNEEINEDAVKVLENSSSMAKKINFVEFPKNVDREKIFEFLSQDLESIRISDQHFQFNVEDILKLNSTKYIELLVPEISAISINFLIKEWINGWNPKLKSLVFRMKKYEDHEAAIADIPHSVVSDNEEREGENDFCPPFDRLSPQIKYDIENKDSVKATIFFGKYVNTSILKIIVYP